MKVDKSIVVPGDFLSDNPKDAGEGTYVEGGKVYASVHGITRQRDGHIQVVPLSGKYIPAKGDIIIGIVKEITSVNWIVDINSPYEALLHISEYPAKIDSDEMAGCLGVGDSFLALIRDVTHAMKVELTLKDPRLRVIRSGRVIDISSTKVPRLIGRGGSMINLLKSETGCSIFVGQNGRVWIEGKDKNIDLAVRCILKIEQEAHTSGLTDKITAFLKKEKTTGKKEEKKDEGVEEVETGEGVEADMEENEGELRGCETSLPEGELQEEDGKDEKETRILNKLLDEN